MTAERSDAQLVLDLMDAFRRSKAMFAAVSLGIFDRLEMSPAGTRELSAEKKCHPGALERLLDTCVALDLLGRQGERYRNLPVAARYLCQDSPDTLAGYILYSNQILYSLWGHLEDAVREGASRWEQTFGGKTSLFEGLFATEESKRDFLQAMHGMGRLSSPSVVASVDLSSFRRLCDVGGATGHLAMAACSRYPGLQATVFDLPEVAPQARRFIAAAGWAERIGVQEGDFFRDPLPPADLYALGRILHDWSEEKITFLLEKIYRQLPDAGGLLVCEKILNPGKDGPLNANLQSLNMLVLTEGGQERTAAEYESLLARAGFRDFQVRPTGQPLDAILAIK